MTWEIIHFMKPGKYRRKQVIFYHCLKHVFNKTIKLYNEFVTVTDLPRAGYPRKTSPRQDRKLLQLYKNDRHASCSSLVN